MIPKQKMVTVPWWVSCNLPKDSQFENIFSHIASSLARQVEITDFFNDVAEPLLQTYSHVWMESNRFQRPSIEGFYHAFSLVSSRAFLVDTFHGLSIVPIADA